VLLSVRTVLIIGSFLGYYQYPYSVQSKRRHVASPNTHPADSVQMKRRLNKQKLLIN